MVVDATFLDPGPPEVEPTDRVRWRPAVVRAAQIEARIAALLAGDRTDADLRRTFVVHPEAADQGRGLAPGIRVSVEALRAGERALPPQRNSASIVFCISGSATAVVDGHVLAVTERDVWSAPSMARASYLATGPDPFVVLQFSNAALLELLGVHWSQPVAGLDDRAPGGVALTAGAADPADVARARTATPGAVEGDDRIEALAEGGPWRLHYERLIDPPWIESRPWHWPWTMVSRELEAMAGLDARYHGRRVCLLYDPATGRTNGTTATLFASMCIRPAGVVDRPHRHVAAAVNYFFEGTGWSTLGGERVDWDAGDLLLAAPGWTTHHHASGEGPVHQLAVQDNPLHLALGSLLWQEQLDEPPRLLGAEPGYTTNRHELEPTDR